MTFKISTYKRKQQRSYTLSKLKEIPIAVKEYEISQIMLIIAIITLIIALR